MPSQSQIRDEVTRRIVQALEADLLPWRRPWRATASASQPGRHSNVASRKAYQGINPMLLELHALRLGLLSRWWATFNQWHDLGCNVRKRPSNVEDGHWGCQVVFWKPLTKKTVKDDQVGKDEDEEERFFVLKTFTIFCADQIEGDRAGEFQVHEDEGQPRRRARLPACRGADFGDPSRHPLWRRPRLLRSPAAPGTFPHHTSGDFICIPPKATFSPPGAFYETAIHELAHWSEVRTGWDHDKQGYALGELAAEIASCYVAAELGIPQDEDLGNHAAYLRSWLEALRNDRNYIFKAAKQASKVTDFLLSFVKKPEPEAVGAVQ